MNLEFPYKRNFMNDPAILFRNGINNSHIKVDILPKYVYKTMDGKQYDVRWRNKFIHWDDDNEMQAYYGLNIMTDYFTEDARMMARYKDEPTPIEYFHEHSEELFLETVKIMNPYGSSKLNINPKSRKFMMYFRDVIWKHTSEANNFKLNVAKELYNIVNAKYILDGSSGWGDRMLGAALRKETKHYTCFDPNPLLTKGYEFMMAFINNNRKLNGMDEMVIQYHQESFLDADQYLSGTLYDTFLSSPPFWDLEIYNEKDEQQSVQGIHSYEEWLDKFYYPYLKMAVKYIKSGGHIVLYITDTKSFNMITKTFEMMGDLPVQYSGAILMAAGKAPIFIWKKL